MKTKVRYKINYNVVIRNILIMITLIILANTFLFPIIGNGEIPTKSIIVASNDTLWAVASNVIKDANDDTLNINKVMHEIKELNNMDSSTIYVGQVLEIPVY